MVNYLLSNEFIVFSLLDFAWGGGEKPYARLPISEDYGVRNKEFKIGLKARLGLSPELLDEVFVYILVLESGFVSH